MCVTLLREPFWGFEVVTGSFILPVLILFILLRNILIRVRCVCRGCSFLTREFLVLWLTFHKVMRFLFAFLEKVVYVCRSDCLLHVAI